MLPFLRDRNFLIIDDEQATVDIVREVLHREGARAVGITNPEKGFGMMAKEKFDAVILDRYMPPVDGHDILTQLKKNSNTKDIPVVMLTSENKSPEIRQSIELGASGYIVKPFTPRSFLLQIEKILSPREGFEVDI